MPEKTVSAFFAPFAAFAGAVIMLLWRKELDPRRMLLAIVGGPMFAWLFTPVVVAGLRSAFAWVPMDWSTAGTVGCLIGMLAINIIATVANVGDKAETVAPGLIQDKGGKDA